jgi:hypothetical protein
MYKRVVFLFLQNSSFLISSLCEEKMKIMFKKYLEDNVDNELIKQKKFYRY